MNIEELEQSLRSEFEGYLRNERSRWRDEVAGLREKFDELAARLDEQPEFDAAFTESVVEHLRLARDQGAEITATAMGEAEKLNGNGTAPAVERSNDVEWLREAICEIRSHKTQALILTALVDAASRFAPRGAFFIAKNDQLIGWKAFACADGITEETVRSIHFSSANNTLLADALASLNAESCDGSPREDDHEFLAPLGFGNPETMWAFPFVVRGRGVAVLYADAGSDGPVNADALETLVSVAGMSVELLANSVQAVQPETARPEAEYVEEPPADEAEVEQPTAEVYEAEAHAEEIYATEYQAEEVYEPEIQAEEAPAIEQPAEPVEQAENNGFAFSTSNFDAQPVEAAVEEAEVPPAEAEVDEVEEAPVEAEVEPTPQRRSYRERAMDLPVEVTDDERPHHSEARRFARLLISEIKLYNEAKVMQAREAGDIYDMLREAIERSREMYEARVKPDVAAKFDYFHYELVNNLAQGDEEKLGAGYLALKA